jgi:hypothetical protein
MDTDAIKIVTPIVTFILGSALTLWMKVAEQRRSLLKSVAQDAVRLTKEWYVQIHTLLIAPPTDAPKGEVNTAIYDYVHNRLILPEYIMCVEILRRRKRAARLVTAMDAFLDDVTYQVPGVHLQYPEGTACAEVLKIGSRDDGGTRPNATPTEPWDFTESPTAGSIEPSVVTEPERVRVLRLLDAHVQRITREAALILV